MAKKILYIYGGLYSPNGMSTIVSQKINYLAENTDNDMYIVLTEHPEKPQIYQLSNKIHRKDLVVNFDDLDAMPFLKKIVCYFVKQRKSRKLITQYLMELRPDITISMTRREINFLSKIKDGSKKVAEIHFARTFYRKFDKKYLPRFVNKLISKMWMNSLIKNLKKLDKFVVLTEEDSKNWPELHNVIVIPNFVSSIPIKKSKCVNKRAIAVGRYSYQKGFDMLIDAWKIVSSYYPDWQLDIYGAGNNIVYQDMANNMGLSSVHCNTAVSNLFDYYSDCSIFILSSRYEGLALVILEAMRAGLPVVAFSCPCGPRDIIKNGENGLLVENGNVQLLAEKICYLIENENERIRMGSKAVDCVAQYNKDAVMGEWIKLFNSL